MEPSKCRWKQCWVCIVGTLDDGQSQLETSDGDKNMRMPKEAISQKLEFLEVDMMRRAGGRKDSSGISTGKTALTCCQVDS